RVDLLTRHTCLRGLQTIRCLEIAEQQAVVTQEQRVVMPASAPQRFEHFRPDGLVVRFVLGKHVRAHFEQKSDSSHRLLLLLSFATNITHNTHHRSSACGSSENPQAAFMVYSALS